MGLRRWPRRPLPELREQPLRLQRIHPHGVQRRQFCLHGGVGLASLTSGKLLKNQTCPRGTRIAILPGIPKETDMETIVVAMTTPHADEQPAASLCEKQLRRITFNGKPLTGQQLRCLESLELSLGLRLPDRDYWCDSLELWSGLKLMA